MKQLHTPQFTPKWLAQAYEWETKQVEGYFPSHLPILEHLPSQYFEVSIAFSEQDIFSNRQYPQYFTIQSISKFFSLFYVLKQHGVNKVRQKVGITASSIAYNTKSATAFYVNGAILNPFINAGALTITSMIDGHSIPEKIRNIKLFIAQQFNVVTIIDEDVLSYERQHSEQNNDILHTLKMLDLLEDTIENTLESYLALCSLKMSTQDLAKIGYLFQQLIAYDATAQYAHKALLASGLYGDSPLSVNNQQIAAKSGISGSILSYNVSSCNQYPTFDKIGIGIYSPLLNNEGNSAKGMHFLKQLFS